MPSCTCLKLFFFLGLNWPKRSKYTTTQESENKRTHLILKTTFMKTLSSHYSDSVFIEQSIFWPCTKIIKKVLKKNIFLVTIHINLHHLDVIHLGSYLSTIFKFFLLLLYADTRIHLYPIL